MHIEYLVTKSDTSQCNLGTPVRPKMESYLLGLSGTAHNSLAAEIFCAASTWAYSDLRTFASMMCHRGLYGEFVGINVKNDAALVDTSAYLFLSQDKKLAILTCRGTDPTNVINWLADASTNLLAQEEGAVHGGFLTAGIVLIPAISHLLLEWTQHGKSLADGLVSLNAKCYPDDVFPPEMSWAALKLGQVQRLQSLLTHTGLYSQNRWPALKERVEQELSTVEERLDQIETLTQTAKSKASDVQDSRPEPQQEKPALYICGHSLGGAFAGMAGGMIYSNPRFKPIKDALRSMYTFGAPMFADKTLADARAKDLGQRLFRHRYKDDIVPLLPGRFQGRYEHFGQSYTNAKDGGWTRTMAVERAVVGTLISNLIGIAAFAKENITLLRWLPLPFSWTDHSPLRYMRTSQANLAGWEILGAELSPR